MNKFIIRTFNFCIMADYDRKKEKFSGIIVYDAETDNEKSMYRKRFSSDIGNIGKIVGELVKHTAESSAYASPEKYTYDSNFLITNHYEGKLTIDDISHHYDFIVPLTITSYSGLAIDGRKETEQKVNIVLSDTEITASVFYTANHGNNVPQVYYDIPFYHPVLEKIDNIASIITSFFKTDLIYRERYKKKYGVTTWAENKYYVYYKPNYKNNDLYSPMRAGGKTSILINKDSYQTDFVGLTVGGISAKVSKLIGSAGDKTKYFHYTGMPHPVSVDVSKHDVFSVWIREGEAGVPDGICNNIIDVTNESFASLYKEHVTCKEYEVIESATVEVTYNETRAKSMALEYAINCMFLSKIER